MTILNDGVLSDTRLMFHDFDESQIRNKKKPEDKCIAQYNPGFLQDMRRFLKSDEDMVSAAAYHIRRNPNTYAVINYMACQDGFTMNDMVTYNYRHNSHFGMRIFSRRIVAAKIFFEVERPIPKM